MKKLLPILSLFFIFSAPTYASDKLYLEGLIAFENNHFAKSFQVFSKLSSEGNPSASAMLIHHYDGGLGVEPDSTKGLPYLALVINQMDNYSPELGYQTGLMFLRLGETSSATEMFEISARYKHPEAAYEIARLKIAALEPQLIDVGLWLKVAYDLDSDKADSLRPIFDKLLTREQGKIAMQKAVQWHKDNSPEKLRQEFEQLKIMMESLGQVTDIVGDLLNSVEIMVDEETAMDLIENLPIEELKESIEKLSN
jgi:TPR repeat protein